MDKKERKGKAEREKKKEPTLVRPGADRTELFRSWVLIPLSLL